MSAENGAGVNKKTNITYGITSISVSGSFSWFSLHWIFMLQRQPSSPQSPVTASIKSKREKNRTDRNSGHPLDKCPSSLDISHGRNPLVCPPCSKRGVLWWIRPKFHLVFAHPFFSTCWWISSLVSLETRGKALQGTTTSSATSLCITCDKNVPPSDFKILKLEKYEWLIHLYFLQVSGEWTQ